MLPLDSAPCCRADAVPSPVLPKPRPCAGSDHCSAEFPTVDTGIIQGSRPTSPDRKLWKFCFFCLLWVYVTCIFSLLEGLGFRVFAGRCRVPGRFVFQGLVLRAEARRGVSENMKPRINVDSMWSNLYLQDVPKSPATSQTPTLPTQGVRALL